MEHTAMDQAIHILMVDDERNVSAMTRDFLQAKGYLVTLVHNGDAGLVAFRKMGADLCLLDIRMPMKDGYRLAEEIREFAPHIPIIFLTGKTEVEDRVKGLKFGAEDYITKPFSLEELELRIANVLKRRKTDHGQHTQIHQISSWSFKPATRQLFSDNKSILLTTTEANLLQLFCEDAQGMLKRDVALKTIWGDAHQLRDRSLNVYVSKLRKYLKDDPNIAILNLHGVGYRLVIR